MLSAAEIKQTIRDMAARAKDPRASSLVRSAALAARVAGKRPSLGEPASARKPINSGGSSSVREASMALQSV